MWTWHYKWPRNQIQSRKSKNFKEQDCEGPRQFLRPEAGLCHQKWIDTYKEKDKSQRCVEYHILNEEEFIKWKVYSYTHTFLFKICHIEIFKMFNQEK